METLAVGLFCIAPIGLFAAGVWIGTLIGKGRLRSPISPADPVAAGQQKRKPGKDPVWEP